ncbi:MAG: 5'/3'-nucleotidase SurE [Actinobacteria bacterium]|nr:5'/3'-nucleotidase SurE [Actinomycetota bacterium]
MGRRARMVTTIGLALVLATGLGGCLYFPRSFQLTDGSGTEAQPWWCGGSPELSAAQCQNFSAILDVAIAEAQAHMTVADALADGLTPTAGAPAGVGYAMGTARASFVAGSPNVLLYESSAPGARLVGFAYAVTGAEPSGFDGDRDHWIAVGDPAVWWLPVWALRGYENQPDVFAASHPCLVGGGHVTATTDPCYVASHPEPFRFVVTNDDGIGAPGIDALVEGLYGLPNVVVDVVAPATNQSGTGDTVTPGGATGQPATTASGRPATAVAGTPGDSVNYALDQLHLVPDLVVSGINLGQNMNGIVALSGTVGAARVAARRAFPSIASSQGGLSLPVDFPTGVTATLDLVERYRLGLAGAPYMTVPNINIPTCAAGTTVRGTVETVVAPALNGRSYTTQNCASTVTVINDDVDAFNNGFIGITDVGLG